MVSVDFMQYAESYYFYDGDDRTSPARPVGFACELADRAAGARRPDVRSSAAALSAALQDLADILDQRFLRTRGAPRQVLEAFAAGHGRHSGV